MKEEIKKEEAAVGRKQSEGREAPRKVKYPRKQTGIRILATLLFGIVVWGILEIILFLGNFSNPVRPDCRKAEFLDDRVC